ncbi:MAG: carbohydrate-binding domain-containing protein [Clostridia bacterium]|nr:carbohydrate-binding domain-containing protein [Clostridia bacterium]
MKRFIFTLLSLVLCAALLASCGAGETADTESAAATETTAATETETETVPQAEKPDGEPDVHEIVLSGHTATLDGESVEEFDYTWHCDPTAAHTDVKDAPAEYYTGSEPDTDAAAYIDSELYYYPSLPEDSFTKVNYDGETEWAAYYSDGENDGYIFATLPVLGAALPTQMMHTEEEASENRVLHITKAGTYSLSGEWSGQIKIDLGDEDETFTDGTAKVTLILNGADVNCTVAPGIIFDDLYECDNAWEEKDEHTAEVDTADAGATLVIADGTENAVSGKNVFRMLKTKYKNEDDTSEIKVQKKMRKTDGALYSYVTMNVTGGGKLTVNSGFEGIDSELHLAFLGGDITVNSEDDGINVNEDNVSVVIFDGASLTVNAAQGAEGDGVDSNGFVVLKSGNVAVNGIRVPDSAIDSEDGVYYYGGTVTVDGEEQSLEVGSVTREIGGGPGGERPGMPDGKRPDGFGGDFDIKDFKEKVASLPDDATIEDVMDLLKTDGMGEPPEKPDGFGEEPPEKPDGEIR